MQGRLLIMPSSSQVLDHQLIFHIMYGLRQFHYQQNEGEERFGKKSSSCLTNIERKRCKKSSCCFPNIEDRKGGKNRGEEGSTGEEPRRVASQQVACVCICMSSLSSHQNPLRSKTNTPSLVFAPTAQESERGSTASTSNTKDGESRHNKHQTTTERERASIASTCLALWKAEQQ